ncbi:MAG TPA: S1C family serine protease [Polyangia bacterium]
MLRRLLLAAVVCLLSGLLPRPLALAGEPRDGLARALDFTVTLEGDGRYGAGVLADPQAGLVVTALHVVDGMHAPRATFHDGTQAPAHLLASDRALDLALLSVPPTRGEKPRLGDPARLRPGDELYAIGCPRRLPFSVARGIVSYVGRVIDGVRWLQTDLPINVGDSGGPVVDAQGEWLGMTSFVLREGQGLSFALPVDEIAHRFARRLALGPRSATAAPHRR